MKLALIQDSLLIKGGSERIFQYIVEEFQEADIFTLAYNPENTWPEFRKYTINTSWANRLIQTHSRFKLFFPVATKIFQNWNFNGYDVILSSSATVAKYISKFKGVHICYCYFPTRAIWNTEEYFGKKTLKSRVFGWLLPYLKQQDLSAAGRVTSFISISEDSRGAINKFYNRNADVLYCPIDHDRFLKGMENKKEGHYLIVSRLERWKNLEYAVKAFNNSGRSLKIIGTGEQEEYLKSISGDNIKFLGNVDDDTLVAEYGKARAVIFTPALEYGLVPLEANAAGTPVIAFGKRGVTETMIQYKINTSEGDYPTAVFFDEPSSTALNNAIDIFEKIHFDRDYLTGHAKKFSVSSFKQAIRNCVENSGKGI